LLYKVYTDFTGMFTDFTSGQLDFTDWPVQPNDLANFTSNPDFFVGPKTPQATSGVNYVDMNHQAPLFNFASPDDLAEVEAGLRA